jgi:hypothetical protein
MISLFWPTQSINYLTVRTSNPSCIGPFSSIRLQIDNAETLVTSSVFPTSASYDYSDFLHIEAVLGIEPNTYYTIQIIQQSASVDCQSIYRGEIYLVSGSGPIEKNSGPFESYDKTVTEYIRF